MSIKQKLILSNIAMVLIPAIIILILSVISSMIFNNYKVNTARQMEFEYINTLQKIAGDPEKSDRVFELCQALEASGSSIKLTSSDEVIYVSPDYEEMRTRIGIGIEDLSNIKHLAFSDQRGSEMFFNHQKNNQEIQLHMFDRNPESGDLVKKDFVDQAQLLRQIMLILFLLAVIIIIMTNAILTSFISKSILTPLKILHEGTNQIKRGNLDHQVIYAKQDEFGSVCADFDDMRVRLKESLLEQQKYEESRKELIAGISHDLGTPLTLIKGYVSGILDGVANTPEKIGNYLRTINSTADNMRRMVDNLFLFSKLDINKVPFYFETVNFVDYLKSHCQEIQIELAKKEMDLVLRLDCEQANVRLDVMQFERAMFNIVDNSTKYKKGDRGKIEISLKEEEDYVFLSIEDDGSGIAKTEAPHIFDIFYRTDKARGETEKGSGLGLAIVKQIVTFHQGEVWAESEVNQGLRITISLPKTKEMDA